MRDYASTLPVDLDLDLYAAGWNGTINPYPGIDIRTFAMQSLRKSLLKKFVSKNSSQADSEALKLFLSINEKCRGYRFPSDQLFEVDAIAFGEAKDFISRFFEYSDQSGCDFRILTEATITQGFSVGNGANIGSPGNDFLSKVALSTMAATDPSLHMFYMQAISEDNIWADVESIRSVNRGFEIVQGSRLSFVPKTALISRTICTEPICNMLFQKGIERVLTKRLNEVSGINLSKQQGKNRRLAQLGSSEGKFGTIDLSSASDSMSLTLVREFFPRHATAWFEMTRSPFTVLPDGSKVELHMVSSMGNAFTFPLQTLFFLAIVYGAYRVKGIPFDRPFGHSLGNFAVNGDDIIVVSEAYDLVCRLLNLSGFSVNVDKSYNSTAFRESCGRDYYCGRNVRGVYIKTLNDMQDVCSAINRLNVWSADHGISLCRTVSSLMIGTRLLGVPFDEADTAGIKVPLRSYKHRHKINPSTGGIFYRYMDVVRDDVRISDISKPPKLRGWFHQPDAVLLAALAGAVRLGRISRRVNRRSAKVRTRYSSSWDYIPFDPDRCPDFGEAWKSYVELNLNLL